MRAARPRKRFGQNFLEDGVIVSRIESAIAPRSHDHLVEIGPGRGALTEALVSSGCRLDAIELDRDLTAGLLAAFSIYPRFRLHSADALEFDYASLLEDASGDVDRLRIVGNLPYNISTPLIFRLLENSRIIEDMHFMLQLEVVQRLAGEPGTGHWGRLGIMAQYHCCVEHLFDVPPTAFYPPPKVQSAVVRLVPWRKSPWPDVDEEALRRTVQSAFAQRRKTLRNNLKGLIGDVDLEALDIDPGARAETLALTDFIAIANHCHA
jgi:16S rRNA (adenine1518-N6/adenine1519-N6)-dimethyltransferase